MGLKNLGRIFTELCHSRFCPFQALTFPVGGTGHNRQVRGNRRRVTRNRRRPNRPKGRTPSQRPGTPPPEPQITETSGATRTPKCCGAHRGEGGRTHGAAPHPDLRIAMKTRGGGGVLHSGTRGGGEVVWGPLGHEGQCGAVPGPNIAPRIGRGCSVCVCVWGMGSGTQQMVYQKGPDRRLPILNSIAFGSAPRREVDSQPFSPCARPAVSQTETHSLGFLSVADASASSGATKCLRPTSGRMVMQPTGISWAGGSNPGPLSLTPPPPLKVSRPGFAPPTANFALAALPLDRG